MRAPFQCFSLATKFTFDDIPTSPDPPYSPTSSLQTYQRSIRAICEIDEAAARELVSHLRYAQTQVDGLITED